MKRLFVVITILGLAVVLAGAFFLNLNSENAKPVCRLTVKSDGHEPATEEIEADFEGVSQAGKLVTRLDVVEASIFFSESAQLETLQLLDLSSGVVVSTKFDPKRTQNTARLRDIYKSLDAEIVCK